MVDVFKRKDLTYNFCNAKTLTEAMLILLNIGTKTIPSLSAKIWKILPNDYKELTSLSTLKSKIKNWETDECHSRL